MTLHTEPADWETLAAPWTALYDRATPAAGPFVGHPFQSAWWEVFGVDDRLDLSAVHDGADLIGVVPLQRLADDDSAVGFVGDASICDYMDVLAAPGREAEVLAVLFDRLDALEASRADLRGLAERSGTLALLPAAAAARGWAVEHQAEAVCPTVPLPDQWDAYLGGLKRRYRHEVRRKLRNLRDGGATVEIEIVDQPDALRERLPDFLRMMVDSRGDKAIFLTEQMVTFFHTLVARCGSAGIVQLYFLLVDGKRVATVLCFVHAGRILLYNSGYDPDFREFSVGIASKVFCLREAIDRGYHELNFLRGDEDYKFHLGAQPSPVTRLILSR